MSKFNVYLNTHFKGSGCRLIARAFDDCRNRRVEIHAMPGHYDVVGVTDGTDAWVAPASAGLFFKTASGDCADIMRRLQAGEDLPPVPDAPARKGRVALEDDEPAPRPKKAIRAALIEDEEPQPRRTRHALA